VPAFVLRCAGAGRVLSRGFVDGARRQRHCRIKLLLRSCGWCTARIWGCIWGPSYTSPSLLGRHLGQDCWLAAVAAGCEALACMHVLGWPGQAREQSSWWWWKGGGCGADVREPLRGITKTCSGCC
jgi:hypothetical protein